MSLGTTIDHTLIDTIQWHCTCTLFHERTLNINANTITNTKYEDQWLHLCMCNFILKLDFQCSSIQNRKNQFNQSLHIKNYSKNEGSPQSTALMMTFCTITHYYNKWNSTVFIANLSLVYCSMGIEFRKRNYPFIDRSRMGFCIKFFFTKHT